MRPLVIIISVGLVLVVLAICAGLYFYTQRKLDRYDGFQPVFLHVAHTKGTFIQEQLDEKGGARDEDHVQ